MEKHEQNIQLYLQNGGDPKLAHRLKNPNLSNRAKIAYLLSQMQITPSQQTTPKSQSQSPSKATSDNDDEVYKPKVKGLGLISQYPVELHPVYREAYNIWIEVCGLKLQLNAVSDVDEEAAYGIQVRMIKLMEKYDCCIDALHHYNQHKRILPMKSKKDYSTLSPVELLKLKNNLAGLISRRKATIVKMQETLPETSDLQYQKKVDSVNRKLEALQKLELDFEHLKEFIE